MNQYTDLALCYTKFVTCENGAYLVKFLHQILDVMQGIGFVSCADPVLRVIIVGIILREGVMYILSA